MNAAIVHVASGREWRGGQRQVWLLARELQRLGVHDQVVVTSTDSELARRLVADGVRVRSLPWRVGLDPRALWAIWDESRARPVLLHAHDSHALMLAGLARVGRRAPLVATRRVTFPLRRRGFWTRANRVIAISSAVRSALIAGGVSAERIEVISSGVDLVTLGDSAPTNLRAQLGIEAGTPLAINIAALTPEKDHGTLLEAAALARQILPTLHWVIVGDGPLHDALSRRIRKLELAQCVSLLGFVAEPERLLADASVFVLSSTAEGLGSSVLAAWARGVPVVATCVGGLAELLGSGAGLLVAPRDPADLSSAVRRIVTDSALQQDLSHRGRVEVRRYEVRGMAERMLMVYRSCAYELDGS